MRDSQKSGSIISSHKKCQKISQSQTLAHQKLGPL